MLLIKTSAIAKLILCVRGEVEDPKLKHTDNMGLVVINPQCNLQLTSKVWCRENGGLVRKLRRNNFPMSSAKTRSKEEFLLLKDVTTPAVLSK